MLESRETRISVARLARLRRLTKLNGGREADPERFGADGQQAASPTENGERPMRGARNKTNYSAASATENGGAANEAASSKTITTLRSAHVLLVLKQ